MRSDQISDQELVKRFTSGDKKAIEILINPLMSWLWIGGIVLTIGSLIAIWPSRRERSDIATSDTPEVEDAEDEIERRVRALREKRAKM